MTICLSSSLLQRDTEKCGRYRKSQDTQCKAPTGHSGGHRGGSGCNQKPPASQCSQIPKHGQRADRQFPLQAATKVSLPPAEQLHFSKGWSFLQPGCPWDRDAHVLRTVQSFSWPGPCPWLMRGWWQDVAASVPSPKSHHQGYQRQVPQNH